MGAPSPTSSAARTLPAGTQHPTTPQGAQQPQACTRLRPPSSRHHRHQHLSTITLLSCHCRLLRTCNLPPAPAQGCSAWAGAAGGSHGTLLCLKSASAVACSARTGMCWLQPHCDRPPHQVHRWYQQRVCRLSNHFVRPPADRKACGACWCVGTRPAWAGALSCHIPGGRTIRRAAASLNTQLQQATAARVLHHHVAETHGATGSRLRRRPLELTCAVSGSTGPAWCLPSRHASNSPRPAEPRVVAACAPL